METGRQTPKEKILKDLARYEKELAEEHIDLSILFTKEGEPRDTRFQMLDHLLRYEKSRETEGKEPYFRPVAQHQGTVLRELYEAGLVVRRIAEKNPYRRPIWEYKLKDRELVGSLANEYRQH